MTDQEWTAKLRAMLREMNDAAQSNTRAPNGVPVWRYIACDIASQAVEPLLAEVERLRSQNAAMREIVQAVENIEPRDTQLACGVCGGYRASDSWGYPLAGKPVQHRPDCPVTKARALLAADTEGE